MTADAVLDSERTPEPDHDAGDRATSWVDAGARPAAVVCAVLAVVAFVYYAVIGRHQWFYADEWDQIVTRSLSNPDDIFRPHNGHWQTVNTVLYRILFRIFGLSTYIPYMLPAIAAFVASAVLIRVITRRAGVGPWIATLMGATLLALGSGMENIVFGIQLSTMGSVAFGMGALVLVDHGARRDVGTGTWWTRRDTFALLCGLMALLCSTLGPTLVGVVTLFLLVRRGWRPAVAFTVPLAVIQLIWTQWYQAGETRPGSAGAVVKFLFAGLDESARDLSQLGTAGIVLLGVILAAGLVLAVRQQAGRPDRTDELASSSRWTETVWAAVVKNAGPLALLAGAVVFYVFTAMGRAGPFGPDGARGERYTALAICFALPILGVAVDAICRQSKVFGALALGFLLIGIPLNVAVGRDEIKARDANIGRARQILLALPSDPLFATSPDGLHPMTDSGMAPEVTVGWLRQAVAEGWIEPLPSLTPELAVETRFRLLLDQQFDDVDHVDCVDLPPAGATPAVVTVEAGDVLHIAGGFVRVTDADPSAVPVGLDFNPNRGDDLVVQDGPKQLALTSGGVNGPGQLCRVP